MYADLFLVLNRLGSVISREMDCAWTELHFAFGLLKKIIIHGDRRRLVKGGAKSRLI